MNAVTEAVEFKPITRTAVLRAMLFADSHVSCAQIAKDAGVSTNAAGASLRRLRDDGIVCSVDSDTGATAWYLNDPEAVRRTLDNDGTPGDDEPAPEPGDTQAVANDEPPEIKRVLDGLDAELSAAIEAAEHQIGAAPTPDADAASLDDPDNFGDGEMPTAAPGPDGWIPWRGGECPVPEGVACWVRLRDGLADICHTPERLFWGRGIDEDNEDDIVAYRLDGPPVAQTPAQNPDGWIPWHGGDCPVPPGTPCWIKFRDGHVMFCNIPSVLWWGYEDDIEDIVAYRLEKPEHVITTAYSFAVAAESAADAAPPAGDDVCSADAVIAEWKREHTPADPTVAPTDTFAVWLADTPAGCAGQRAIDAAEQEAARLRAEAAEMVREAEETRQRGLIVAEIIQFADQRNVSTSTSEEEFGLAELLAAAYEAVAGKRVA